MGDEQNLRNYWLFNVNYKKKPKVWEKCKQHGFIAMHYVEGFDKADLIRPNIERMQEISKGDGIVSYSGDKSFLGVGKAAGTYYEENNPEQYYDIEYLQRIKIDWIIAEDKPVEYSGTEFMKTMGINEPMNVRAIFPIEQSAYEYVLKLMQKNKPIRPSLDDIPRLSPSDRSREYRLYHEDLRDKVIYYYLFKGMSHRWIDENILDLNAEISKGYQAMGILRYLGLKEEHKGLFENANELEAIEILKKDKDYGEIANALSRFILVEDEDYPDDSPDAEYPEGEKAYKTHRVIERNQKVIKEAKKQFAMKHNGRLFCEACGIDFTILYGERGKGFIEGHHTKLVSEMKEGEKTKTGDIAMLCSNCHRMIHRKPLITIEGLFDLFHAEQ